LHAGQLTRFPADSSATEKAESQFGQRSGIDMTDSPRDMRGRANRLEDQGYPVNGRYASDRTSV
jgi:hypothetical protein